MTKIVIILVTVYSPSPTCNVFDTIAVFAVDAQYLFVTVATSVFLGGFFWLVFYP